MWWMWKNELFINTINLSSVNLSNLTNRWNIFHIMLNGFSDMLEEQK